ncbi:MAG: hypothetical protein ABEK01_02665 [Candidatus Nanohaloarchaea archaeon]
MALPLVGNLPAPFQSIAVVFLLIVLFVIAYKVLETIMETFLVTGLSGGFYYAVQKYIWGTTPAINDILMFAFIGGALFMAYTVLSSAYSVASELIQIPYKILKILLIPFRRIYLHLREKSREKVSGTTTDTGTDGDGGVREAVLDNTED